MAFYVETRTADKEVIEKIGPITERQAEQLAATVGPNKAYSVHIVEDNTVEDGN